MSLFLTGCTGYVGKHFLYYLLKLTNRDVVVCIRSKKGESGQKRFETEIQAHPMFQEPVVKTNCKRVRVVEKDLSELIESDLLDCTDVVHCAANVKFTAPLENLLEENVNGLKQLYEISKGKHFIHISTCYVHPKGKQLLHKSEKIPDQLTADQFICNYAYTKYLAEQYLYKQKSPVTIVRLSCVGRPLDPLPPMRGGAHLAILEAAERATIPDIWIPSKFQFSTVPVDSICKELIEVLKQPQTGLKIVQYSAPKDSKTYNLTAENLLKYKESTEVNIWTDISYEEFTRWMDMFYWFTPTICKRIKDANAVIQYVSDNITFESDLQLPDFSPDDYVKLNWEYTETLVKNNPKPRNWILSLTFIFYKFVRKLLYFLIGFTVVDVFKYQKEKKENPFLLIAIQFYAGLKSILGLVLPVEVF